jgi:hypothetical protein
MANGKGHLIKVPPSAAATRFVNNASAMTGPISAKTPPKQGVRERTEPLKILTFEHEAIFPPLPVSLHG